MTRVEEAVAYFKEGFSCSQAILTAYGPTVGLDRETALKVASGFGGGMGRLPPKPARWYGTTECDDATGDETHGLSRIRAAGYTIPSIEVNSIDDPL